MKKAANRKPRHNTRRGKARSAGTRSHAPTNSTGAPHRLGRDSTRPNLLGRIAQAGSLFAAPVRRSGSSTRTTFAWFRRFPNACTRAVPIRAEDRETFALLLAPFFILAIAIAGNQSIQLGKHLKALIARPVAPVMLPAGNEAAHRITLRPDSGVGHLVHPVIVRQQTTANWIEIPDGLATARTAPDHEARAAATVATLPPSRTSVVWAPHLASGLPPDSAAAPAPPTQRSLTPGPPAGLMPMAMPALVANVTPEWHGVSTDQRGRVLAAIGPSAMEALVAFDEERDMATRHISLFERCSLPVADAGASRAARTTSTNPPTPIAPATWFAPAGTPLFGQRLAAAARRQLGEFVVYNDAYRHIAYPSGDVAKLYGVCTDVVIRAYRDVGIDLQVAVQNAHVGSGDRNIDHRRTETLRRFFQRAGESLPVTTFAEDYLPGDIVTYARPQNTGTASRSHIAVVSDVIAPSGRPMIVHNRGWGPQLEDALFVDRITGHYRYAGPMRSAPAGEASTTLPSMGRRSAQDRPRTSPPRSRRTASTHPTVR